MGLERLTTGWGVVILLLTLPALAVNAEDDPLEDELSTMEDADFPNLVAADETGGIMNVANPAGILEPQLIRHMGNQIFVMGRLGYRWRVRISGIDTLLETGLKIRLPISLDYSPTFRFREKGGGTSPFGFNYGGDEMARLVTAYLKGSL